MEGETHCFPDSKALGDWDTEPGRCDAKMGRLEGGWGDGTKGWRYEAKG